jgi:hypothetical protein
MLKRLVIGGISALLLASCSNVVHERTQYIRFTTPHAEGAKCYIEDSRGYHWRTDATPEVLKVDKDFPPLIVTCQKPGFHKTVLDIDEYYNPKVIGDFAADKIGYVLYPWQKSSHEYPSTVTIWMRPLTFKNRVKQAEWERELWQFLRDEEQKKWENDKTIKGIAERNYQKIQESWENYDPPFRVIKRSKVLVTP